jgi:hypothetical protein
MDTQTEVQSIDKGSRSVFQKISQVIAVIFFVCSLGIISSKSVTQGWLADLHNLFVIMVGITFFVLLADVWKNRKTGKKWFGWRWIIYLIVLSVLSLGTAIFSAAVVSVQENAAVATDSWDIYNAQDTRFSARFPSTPVHETQYQDTQNGQIKIDNYKQADHTASVLYTVNVSEFAAGVDLSDSSTILKSTVDLSAKNGAVLSSNETTYAGYPAISYLIEFNHPNEVSRIKGINILVGQRLYQVMTAYDKQQENLVEYDKFVNSFQIN